MRRLLLLLLVTGCGSKEPPAANATELKPVLTASAPVGALSPADVHAVVTRHRPEMQRCADDARSAGSLKVAFVIAANGSVKTAAAEDVKALNDAAVKCVVATFQAMTFPSGTGDTETRFPIKLEAKP